MNRFLRRSKSKKAFTMVELVVVIAIIGVLAALILPNLMTSDVPVKAKGYAKDYFFVTQEFFSRQKLALDPNPADSPFGVGPGGTSALHDITFYTEFDNMGQIASNGVLPFGNTNMVDSDTFQSTGAIEPLRNLVAAYDTYMDQHLTVGERAGYLYCTVDDNFRVQVCYWSDADITELRAADSTLTFNDDYIIGGYWCASYPPELSEEASATANEMFDYF